MLLVLSLCLFLSCELKEVYMLRGMFVLVCTPVVLVSEESVLSGNNVISLTISEAL